MTAAQEKGGLAELAVLAFQLVELLRAAAASPDVERYGELAARAQRTLQAHGVQLAGFVKRDLDPAVTAALAARLTR